MKGPLACCCVVVLTISGVMIHYDIEAGYLLFDSLAVWVIGLHFNKEGEDE